MNRVLVAGLLVAALTVRVLVGLAPARPLASDERDYDALAWTLVTTAQYGDEGRPTAYRPVGYPAFVAGVYALAGRSPRAVRAVQTALDAATAWLLLLALRRRSPRAAVSAAALWAFYPPAVTASALLYPETLFCFLLSLAAFGFVVEPDRSAGFRFALGLLVGVMILVKTSALIFFFLLPWLVLRGERRWRRAAWMAVGALLVVVPWMGRNARTVGSPVLSTSAASNLLIGNHPRATGGYAADVPDSMIPRSTAEADAAREASRAAVRYIADHPGRFAVMVVRRWAHLLMGEGELAVSAFHPRPADRATSYRAKVAEVGTWRLLLLWAPYAMILVVGVGGLQTRRWDPLAGVLVALVAAWLLVHGATFGGGRFHAPWMPLLTAFAAERLTGTGGVRRWRGARVLAWIGIGVLCLTLWLVEASSYL